MLKNDIEDMKKTLNTMIDMDEDYNKIYEVSVLLDHLILQYYYEDMRRQ